MNNKEPEMKEKEDYAARLGARLEAAYMLEYVEPVMSREEFHQLIKRAELLKRKQRRKPRRNK